MRNLLLPSDGSFPNLFSQFGVGKAGEIEDNTFCFTVQTTVPDETFALPLFADGTYNFKIHHGDDSEDTITSWNQAEVTHAYASAGTHRIQISGICTKFAFDGGGDCAKVRKVLNVPDLGFTKLNFYGCSGLNEVKRPLKKLNSLTSFVLLFAYCNLTSIPNKFFDNNPQITDLSFAFYDNNISSLPASLLYKLTNLTILESCFYKNAIPSIPVGFLNFNTKVTNMIETFRENAITSLNAGLLDTLILLTNLTNCFFGNQLTGVPSGFLDNNTELTSLQYTFSNNLISSVPTGFLDNNTKVTDVSRIFRNNNITSALEADLFANLSVCTDVSYAFFGSANMTGSGLDFIAACPASITGGTTTGCFSGDTSLSDYASIPAAWGGGGA